MFSDSLLAEIDNTAITLLSKIKGGDSVSSGAADPQIDRELLMEQVKAFAEVVKWAQIRSELINANTPKKDTKLDGLKSRFGGSASGGRRGRPPKPSEDGDGTIVDFPAAVSADAPSDTNPEPSGSFDA